jgi:phage gp29-like protein
MATGNWSVSHAAQTRGAAVTSTPWSIEPGDDTPAAKSAASAFEDGLKKAGGGGLDGFPELLNDLSQAFLPGLAVSEIVWEAGGRLGGFARIPPHLLTADIRQIDPNGTGWLLPDGGSGAPMPPGKFIVLSVRSGDGSPAGGGLARTLAWPHCFMTMTFKDLMCYAERHGMPFVVAKVGKESFDTDRAALSKIIKGFGPQGGGLFSKDVELELLQSSQGAGDIYFKLVQACEDAIVRTVLGQTATSSAGGGWSADGAQAAVRRDIMLADCATVAAVVNGQLVKPWAAFNLSAGIAAPKFKFLSEAKEDVGKLAALIDTLQNAGLLADPEEMSTRFGMKLTRATPAELLANDKASLAGTLAPLAASGSKSDLPDVFDAIALQAQKDFQEGGGQERWAGRALDSLQSALDDESGSGIKRLGSAEAMALFDSDAMARAIEAAMIAGAASGTAAKAAELAAKTKGG